MEYIYRVVKRARMPYGNYAAARDKAWDDTIEGASAEDEKMELRRILEELKSGEEL